jgi:hypothetical protein
MAFRLLSALLLLTIALAAVPAASATIAPIPGCDSVVLVVGRLDFCLQAFVCRASVDLWAFGNHYYAHLC